MQEESRRSQGASGLLIALVGPTASGKSALGVDLARRVGGEIVNCDSMQTIRGMDVGTAKPTAEERAAVAHHLFDIVEPDERYSAGRYMIDARRVCREIAQRRHVPIVVGGTGLYLRALLEGVFEGPAGDTEIRSRLHKIAESRGDAALHRLLSKRDPASAKRIHPSDRVRLIRALEVYFATGNPISRLQRGCRPLEGFSVLKAGLRVPREILYDRIRRRVEGMFRSGFVEETRDLLDRGFSADSKGFEALGYGWAIALIEGRITLSEAIERTCGDTRRYAKRQMTWFRKEKDLHWIEGPGERSGALEDLMSLLSRQAGSGRIGPSA